jgi:threonine aldolase
MDQAEMDEILSRCTRFLGGHQRRTVGDQLREIAASPFSAVGADRYGKGGYVAELEYEIAHLLGKEEAVFMPSGTMAQQIALRIWADRAGNKRIAFHPTCHLEIHEHGAYRELHGLEAYWLGQPDRLFTLHDLKAAPGPFSSILNELPQREIGGQLPTWEELTAICRYGREQGARLHLDGARLWECAPYYGRPYDEIAAPFDSVYVSFYKILGGLPGAALAGPSDLIREARLWQRRHGGHLQQMSPNAIAAKIGLDRHLPRIGLYVEKAKEIAAVLREFPEITVVPSEPQVNMMHLYLPGDRQRLTQAAWQLARDEQTFLFGSFIDTARGNKVELTVGEAALEWSAEYVLKAFQKLLRSSGVAAAYVE